MQLTFVIADDKRLCTGETVLDLPLLLDDSDTVLWQNNEGGYYYSLSLLPNSTRDSSFSQGRLDMFSSSGRQYGSFSGTRTSLSAVCGDAKGASIRIWPRSILCLVWPSNACPPCSPWSVDLQPAGQQCCLPLLRGNRCHCFCQQPSGVSQGRQFWFNPDRCRHSGQSHFRAAGQ